MGKLLTGRNIAIVIGLLVILIGGRILFPVPLPTIQPAAEHIPGTPFTNTFLATLLADVTLLVLAFLSVRNLQMVPSGLQNLAEWIINGFYNLTHDVAGPYARKFFPLIMTIFLLVLIANWWELVPGFDSIGVIEHPEREGVTVYKIEQLGPFNIVTAEQVGVTEKAGETGGEHSEKEAAVGAEGGILVPFLRAAPTDLNFTLALALISVIYTQIAGVQAQGLRYFSKFFANPAKAGPIMTIAGLIELVTEVAKIISFSFRLFGNIFAGQVLLFVMPFLTAFLLPVVFFGFEVFVGFIQAFVFAMLTLVFLAGAVISHDGAHPESHGT